MIEKDIYALMLDLVKYYPVGLNFSPESYFGYQEWRRIGGEKINGIIEGKLTPWRASAHVSFPKKGYD